MAASSAHGSRTHMARVKGVIGFLSLRQHRVEYKADGGVARRRVHAINDARIFPGFERPAAVGPASLDGGRAAEDPRDKNGASW